MVEAGERDRHALVLLTIARGASAPDETRGRDSSPRSVAQGPRTSAEDHDLGRRLGLAIASRTFESAGGRLYGEEDDRSLRLRLLLPLAAKA